MSASPVLTRGLRGAAHLVIVLATLWSIGTACFVVFGRIAFPWEIEFMTGSVLDHVERLRAGEPIYVEPSSGFMPFLYPPVYYWIVAALGGTALVGRIVSVVAMFGQGWLVWRGARVLGATRIWAVASVGCYAGCFFYVGYWYDLERADGLVAALVLASAVVLVGSRTVVACMVAGAIAATACFTKQQAIFYAAGSVGGLAAAAYASDAGSRTPASAAGGASPRSARIGAVREVAAFVAGAMIASFVLLFGVRGPWAEYYLLTMPRAHGLMWSLFRDVMDRDFFLAPLLYATTALSGAYAFFGVLRRKATRAEIVFASVLLAGFAAALSSRLHIGGFVNVLLPWTSFASVAVGAACSKLDARVDRARFTAILVGIVALQLNAWRYDPNELVPMRKTVKGGQALRDFVRELETRGEVLVTSRGHVTHPRRFHVAALADVARVEGHSPPELVEKLRGRQFVAVIDDIRPWYVTPKTDWPPTLLEDFEDLRGPLLEGYYVAERLDGDTFVLALPAPANPVWVYRPRRRPLSSADPRFLRALQLAERSLAYRRFEAKRLGEPEPCTAEEVEGRALADVEEAAATRPWLAQAMKRSGP